MNVSNQLHLNLNPQQSLERLKEGNQRFLSGVRSVDSMMSSFKLPLLAERGQKPFAMVLTCSDSRVPVEMVFDQGVGDLFVIRVAGNVISETQLASIEFAATQFKSSLLLVLGHTQCGAVKACLDHAQSNQSDKTLTPATRQLFTLLKNPIQDALGQRSGHSSHNALLDLATIGNVEYVQKEILRQSAVLKHLVDEGNLALVGGVFNISNGAVEFLNDNTEHQDFKRNNFTSGGSYESFSN